MSERRACRVVGQPRSSHRYAPERPAQDRTLARRLCELSTAHPRYYRRAWAVIRGEGWVVNRKRVHRLWREAGLQVPQKTQKRRCLGTGENSKDPDRPFSGRFNVRLTPDLHRAAAIAAEAEDENLNHFVWTAVAHEVERRVEQAA